MTDNLPAAPGDGRGTAWWPAVDALRGLAVAAVLLYHHDPVRFPGGFLGVSLFFTLSGFLITTLVLREHAASGTVRLGRFWARRFRRLAPVALLGLLLALAVGAALQPERIATIGGDARAAALNVANWRFAGAPLGYADTLLDPSPVSHYWSLAIEEQFYAVFPVLALLALKRGRHALASVFVVVCAISLWRQVSLDDNNRIYLGTDTRVLELAVGGLMAIAWSARARWRSRAATRTTLDLLAGAGLVALGGAWATTTISDGRLWRGGMALHAVLSAIVVVGAISGRALPALGRLAPLVALGRVSYGVYVVHVPLYLVLSPDRMGISGAGLLAVRVAACVLAAAALHVLVEQPVRLGGALPRWQAPVGLVTGVAAVLVLSAGLPRADAVVDQASVVATDLPTIDTMVPPLTQPAGATAILPAEAAAAVSTTAVPPGGPPPPPATAPPVPATTPATAPATTEVARVPRLLVMGDSTGKSNGIGMQAWAASAGRASVDVVWHYGCTFLLDGELKVREGWYQTAALPCVNLVDTTIETARSQSSDAVVVFMNSMQLGDWRLPGEEQWRAFGDPVFEERFRAAAREVLGRLSVLGIPVVLADVPTPEWVCELSGPLPGSGAPTVNNAARAARYNAVVAEEASAFPLVRVVPFAAALAGDDGTISTEERPDGLHVTTPAMVSLMESGFEATLVDAMASVSSGG